MPIIPFEPVPINPRDALACEIADIINESITGSGEIHVWELASMIVDTIENVKLAKA